MSDELRKRALEELERAISEYEDDIDQLKAENSNLRELVLTLYMCSEFLCWRCKHERGNTCDFDAENELRELGIEVDE